MIITEVSHFLFCGAIKKALMVPEGRSHQTQSFAKIFPSALALMLQIHFYLHFQKSTQNCALNSHNFQKCNLLCTRKCTRKYVFYTISQKFDYKFGGKAGDQFCFDEIDQFYKYFFFLHAASFVIGETPQPHMAGEKLCL